MGKHMIGLLLGFQFFTSLPIHKNLPMNRQTVTAMYTTMPILGLLMGSVIAFLINLNEYVDFSNLLLAILIVVANIAMTGGLHLDGWIDMGDAYFSYQDKQRRLEILEDSRVGAFGAISLVVLIILKIGFFYEALTIKGLSLYFILIPVLSRMALLCYFLTMKNVKETGLAAYFKSQVVPRQVWMTVIIYTVCILGTAIYFKEYILIFLIVTMFLLVSVYRNWTRRNFGGMTGDLIGALYEGMELVLWGVLLLFV